MSVYRIAALPEPAPVDELREGDLVEVVAPKSDYAASLRGQRFIVSHVFGHGVMVDGFEFFWREELEKVSIPLPPRTPSELRATLPPAPSEVVS